MTDIKEARRLFSRPPESEQISVDESRFHSNRDDDAAAIMKYEVVIEVPTETESEKWRKAQAIATKARKRYAIVDGDAMLLFGKYRNWKVSELIKRNDGKDYLRWMLTTEFPEPLLEVIKVWLAK